MCFEQAGGGMTMLPEAAWRREPGLLRVLDALGGAAMTRAVGGAVRDTLLGLPVSDVDLATKLRPDDVVARLAAGAATLRDMITMAWLASENTTIGWPPFSLADVSSGKIDPFEPLIGQD